MEVGNVQGQGHVYTTEVKVASVQSDVNVEKSQERSRESGIMREETANKGDATDSSKKDETFIAGIEKANRRLIGNNKELSISIHEKTKQIMVKIIDPTTKEVLQEVPPEKIVDMIAGMCEAAGLFVDEKR